MLQRLVDAGKLRRLADLAHLDVVLLVLTDWNIVERQVGNDRQRIAQLGVKVALGRFALGELILQRRHLGHQRVRFSLVLRRLGGADLLRRRVAARLRLLQLGHVRAPSLVERDQLGRLRRQPARAELGVELLGIVPDPLDVEHVGLPLVSASCRHQIRHPREGGDPRKLQRPVLARLCILSEAIAETCLDGRLRGHDG
jgi:hypothetical protein